MNRNLGIIGLGLVGSALYTRPQAQGYAVHGFDIDDKACETARTQGVAIHASPLELSQSCPTIILSLPDSGAVHQVLWGTDGLAKTTREAALILDSSTIDPRRSLEHWGLMKAHGHLYVDIPFVGSSAEIAKGEAIVLVGAGNATFGQRPLLDQLARHVYFTGGPASAHKMKLVLNLVLGLNRAVLAEGLAFAAKLGMDEADVLEILRHSPAYSYVMDAKGARMVNRTFEPVARLHQHAKDVGLICELADESVARAPFSTLHAQLLKTAIEHGWGDLDNSAVRLLFD